MFDIFFISNNEPFADENFLNAKELLPTLKRISGIDGIHNAHYECSKKSFTENFFTIDYDNILNPEYINFIIDYEWNEHDDKEVIQIFYANNPVNNLIYGWGGIKLWHKNIFLSNSNYLDFTTAHSKIKIKPIILSMHKFNISKYETFKSVFREIIKLSYREKYFEDLEASLRLNMWRTSFNESADFVDVAKQAIDIADTFFARNENLEVINNYNYLKIIYRKYFEN